MDIQSLSPELKQFFETTIASQREQLETQVKSLVASAKYDDSEIKSALTSQVARLDGLDALLKNPENGKGKDAVEFKSAGELLWESEERKNYVARAKHNGGFVVGVKSLFPDLELKTTIDSAALGSETPGILTSQRIAGVKWAGTRGLRVRDLIRVLPTGDNAVSFVKENAFTNAAYPQTESSAKAESALTFTIDSAPVRTIAHWIPASAQALADAGWLQDAINFRLLSGLADQEDFELLRGDGTGSHISGLITEATAWNTASYYTAGHTLIDQISDMLEQLSDSERMATGIVMRPSYWWKILRMRSEDGGANTGMYLLGGPAGVAVPVIWGKPVALTTAMPPGKVLVGDFQNGCNIFDRMDARIDVSNSHSDFFVKNLVAIRAEERIALAVYRSDYFVYGSFNE